MTFDVDLIVRGGTVVNAAWSQRADLVIQDGRVLAVTRPDCAERHYSATWEIDARGRFVLPGGVDPHCHVGFSSGAFTTRDDYAAATRAAVFGGTTTIVDFAIPAPGESPIEKVRTQRDKAAQGICDSALHACITEWAADTDQQLDSLVSEGVVTVKMFTTYRGETMASDDTILKVMERLRALGGMAYVHCESNHLIEHAQDACARQHAISAENHHRTRPVHAEVAAVSDILAIAEALDAPVYFVHQSSTEAVNLVRRARARGIAAFTEVVAHHLVLDEDVYLGQHPERFVCCPPLRPRHEVDNLLAAVLAGSVDTIGSDHCCYDTAQKEAAQDDVRLMPNGLPGVETRLPVLHNELVVRRGLPLEHFVALTAANPARLNGIYPRKGALLPGSDADLAIWNPTTVATVSSASLHMATDYTPYEGCNVTGWPETVLVRGRVVVNGGQLARNPPPGRHVPGARIHVAGQPLPLQPDTVMMS